MKTPSRKKKAARRMQNILVPVDFSEAARNALRYALALADQSQSRLLVMHVVAPSEADNAVNLAKKRLADFCKREGVPSKRCTLLVRAGTPFHEITHGTTDERADLIILGRHEMPAEKLSENHTLERVVRYATCPLLLVREGDRDFVLVRNKG
jgi:nucleotide-binding universal stress UspA family protein